MDKVEPPAALPDFVTGAATSKESDFVRQTEFTAAVPKTEIPTTSETIQAVNPPKVLDLSEDSLEKSVANALSPITQGSSLLLGWMKDTVKSGVQKAKSSVDMIVTTLDPQMKDYLRKLLKFPTILQNK